MVLFFLKRGSTIKSSYDISEQLRTSWPAVLVILMVSSALMGSMLFLHFWIGGPISELTRDPISILGGSIYQGSFSQIGIFFWAASATVCLFVAFVIERSSFDPQLNKFLIVSGFLSLFLGLDDVFLLHEEFFPSLGINQNVVLLSYVFFVLWWLLKFHKIILQSESIPLGMACLFFGISFIIDIINPNIRSPQFYEDGAKIVGLVSWLVYFFKLAAMVVSHDVAFPSKNKH